MPNGDRLEVEQLFREGSLRVVVATSAFGEGIDLPDVPTSCSITSTSTSASSISRPGAPAATAPPRAIHLLYGKRDRGLNDFLIDLDAPPLRCCANSTAACADSRATASCAATDARYRGHSGYRSRARPHHRRGVAHLQRLGARRARRGRRRPRTCGSCRCERRVEMERNERYAEGEATREAFARFAEIALGAPATTLERIINRPIYPSGVALRR